MGEATTLLNGVITENLLSGVLNELIGVIPVVFPVCITFLSVRKAISFVLGMIQGA